MTIFNRLQELDLEGLIEVDEETGCWLWTGRTNAKGYPLVDVNDPEAGRTTRRAHRIVFEASTGFVIPEGLQVLHLCHTPGCVNYRAHLAIGTDAANKADSVLRRRGLGRYAGAAA